MPITGMILGNLGSIPMGLGPIIEGFIPVMADDMIRTPDERIREILTEVGKQIEYVLNGEKPADNEPQPGPDPGIIPA